MVKASFEFKKIISLLKIILNLTFNYVHSVQSWQSSFFWALPVVQIIQPNTTTMSMFWLTWENLLFPRCMCALPVIHHLLKLLYWLTRQNTATGGLEVKKAARRPGDNQLIMQIRVTYQDPHKNWNKTLNFLTMAIFFTK